MDFQISAVFFLRDENPQIFIASAKKRRIFLRLF